MGFLKKILNKKTPLEDIKQKEETHHTKSINSKEYYFSEEAKTKGKQIYHDKKEYIKNNPQDYEIVGAQIHQTTWHAVQDLPPEERKILELTGKGKYYEDQGEYEKAIEIYQQADDLTMKVCENDIKHYVAEYGPGDYFYTSKIRQRIRVCKRKLGWPKSIVKQSFIIVKKEKL